MRVIWATRGREWGFRFLRDGGFADPLPTYESYFSAIDGGPSAFGRVETAVAVRFPDPEGRMDSAGRVIPHELVVFSPASEQIESIDDALEKVWPLLADEYESIWAKERR